jgi:hypothetical protein
VEKMEEEMRKAREYIQSICNKLNDSETLLEMNNMNAELKSLTKVRDSSFLSKDFDRIDQTLQTLGSKTSLGMYQLQPLVD